MSSDVLARERAGAQAAAGITRGRETDLPRGGEGRAGWRRSVFLLVYPVAAIALLVASGPLWPVVVALLFTVGIASLGVGLRRRHRRENRGHLEVTGGSRWPWHPAGWLERREAWRNLRRVEAQWEFIVRQAGIPTAELLVASWGPEGYAFRIRARGYLVEDVRAGHFHSGTGIYGRFEVWVPDPIHLPAEMVVREMAELEAGPVAEEEA